MGGDGPVRNSIVLVQLGSSRTGRSEHIPIHFMHVKMEENEFSIKFKKTASLYHADLHSVTFRNNTLLTKKDCAHS